MTGTTQEQLRDLAVRHIAENPGSLDGLSQTLNGMVTLADINGDSVQGPVLTRVLSAYVKQIAVSLDPFKADLTPEIVAPLRDLFGVSIDDVVKSVEAVGSQPASSGEESAGSIPPTAEASVDVQPEGPRSLFSPTETYSSRNLVESRRDLFNNSRRVNSLEKGGLLIKNEGSDNYTGESVIRTVNVLKSKTLIFDLAKYIGKILERKPTIIATNLKKVLENENLGGTEHGAQLFYADGTMQEILVHYLVCANFRGDTKDKIRSALFDGENYFEKDSELYPFRYGMVAAAVKIGCFDTPTVQSWLHEAKTAVGSLRSPKGKFYNVVLSAKQRTFGTFADYVNGDLINVTSTARVRFLYGCITQLHERRLKLDK